MLLLACASPRAQEVPKVGDALTFETADGRFAVEPIMQLQVPAFIEQDLESDGEASAGVFIRRARLGLRGHLFTEDLRYEVEGNWDSGQPALQDAFVIYAIAPALLVQAGQFKRPFSRSFIASSSKRLSFERALPDRRFLIGRDLGVMLHNDYMRSPNGLEYAVGLFNGTGDDVRFTDDLPDFGLSHVPDLIHPLLMARVGVNVGGIDGYKEGDLEGGPPRVAVATSVALDAPTATNPGFTTAEVDFALKAYGAWATGALFLESGPLTGDSANGELGGHLEGSYTIARSLLPFVSYSMVAPLRGDTARHELKAGAAILLYGYHAKLMTDAVLGLDQGPIVTQSDASVRFGVEVNL